MPSHQFGNIGLMSHVPLHGEKSKATTTKVNKAPVDSTTVLANYTRTTSTEKPDAGLSSLLENFTVDDSTFSVAQIRAAFYPKFENENSDQEIRTRMIKIVSKGLATLEVSLKHSGSLFMYAGHEGGAYSKNSYGNIYTAVGVFVLRHVFREAWGSQANMKQAEFNEFLECNRMCISMELVTAVLGDHGQRPREDYVVVTAVTELGSGIPKFYQTPDIIAFCRKWRLPTNHIWLFSTRKSVTSFFAAYDAFCEEGTTTPVCKTLDDIADISVPGSKDHVKVQGEILEGLVARIVSHESSKHMEQVLRDYPPPPSNGGDQRLGSSLREICAANRNDERQLIKALIDGVGPSFCPNSLDWFGHEASHSHSRNVGESVLDKFLNSRHADLSTEKLKEMFDIMKECSVAFKCYHNFHKVNSVSSNNLHFKMVIHVRCDKAFRLYQKKMRCQTGLWPLYRGFFVDLNLFKVNKERYAEFSKENNAMVETGGDINGASTKYGLADEDANLMIKMKFLTYKSLRKMTIKHRHILLLVMLHQIMCRSFLILLLLRRHRLKLCAKRVRENRRIVVSYSMTQRMNMQMNHLHRIIEIGDVQCVVNLRMTRNAFARLCYLLSTVGGLVESRYVRIEEKVAMFLSILAHHKKNRVVGHDYVRSGHTISIHFHEVLQSILMLHPILLVKPSPIDDACSNESWKWFKGCLGALDGTYVSVHVPTTEKARYRTRKGTIAVNVLGVCDRDMKFIYALTGWEGSAADSRVLRDALTRDETMQVPRGCYYLCDNGYANVEGFLTPYRRVRYHRDAWGNRGNGPQNYKELFNWRHSQARNVIERAFGLLKKRWAILRTPSFYPLKTQNRIIMACMLLHNFIRFEMPDDPIEELNDDVSSPGHEIEDDFINSFESSDHWDTWRENLAMSMWNSLI